MKTGALRSPAAKRENVWLKTQKLQLKIKKLVKYKLFQ